MSTIRRQSLLSSLVVYIGFALGFFNTYLFTREGGFAKEEYGLTGAFIAVANVLFSFANLGMPAYISKFYPYYAAHEDPKKSDQLSWALLLPSIGFVMAMGVTILFKDTLIDRVFSNSPQLPYYFYWIFPFGFGYTLFMVLEAYAWQRRQAVFSNFLKEILFRLLTTVLIVLTTIGIIDSFDTFIKLYAFLYLVIVILMISAFLRKGAFTFTFSIGKVTRRFYSKIVTLVLFVWGGGLVFNLASVFDTIILAAVLPNGLAVAGIFTLAQNISSLIQAPQRAVISASVGPLSQAWKDKDMERIQRVYQRSSINQLIFSTAMFSLIWINFDDAIVTFSFQKDYAAAKWVFLFIGLTRVIDMGTGVNAQIIATSTRWKFEFVSGLILLGLSLPLNYLLTRQIGLIGPAITNLIAFTIYNGIRYHFLWKRFNLQPFTRQTLYTLLLAGVAFVASYYPFADWTGLLAMVCRSSVFLAIFGLGTYLMKLSPDVEHAAVSIRKRLGLKKQ